MLPRGGQEVARSESRSEIPIPMGWVMTLGFAANNLEHGIERRIQI
jgi:hypothetical protein